MSKVDKITGRIKQAAGDLTNDASMRQDGREQERKGEAKQEAALAEERKLDKEREVAELEGRDHKGEGHADEGRHPVGDRHAEGHHHPEGERHADEGRDPEPGTSRRTY